MPIKKLHPAIEISYKKDENSVRLNYAQMEGVIRKIIFDPAFLRSLKRSMEAV